MKKHKHTHRYAGHPGYLKLIRSNIEEQKIDRCIMPLAFFFKVSQETAWICVTNVIHECFRVYACVNSPFYERGKRPESVIFQDIDRFDDELKRSTTARNRPGTRPSARPTSRRLRPRHRRRHPRRRHQRATKVDGSHQASIPCPREFARHLSRRLCPQGQRPTRRFHPHYAQESRSGPPGSPVCERQASAMC